MKTRTLLYGFVVAAAMVLLVGQVASVALDRSGMSDQELLEAMKDYAKVGKTHRALTRIKPRNQQTIKWWPSPGAQPRESESRSDSQWILGGRFLTQTIKGDWLGIKFEIYAVLGYDNATEEYQLVWMSDQGTHMAFTHGKADSSGDTITLRGELYDPIDEKTRKVRIVFQILNKKGDTLLTVYDESSPDREFKFLEVNSTRFIARGA